MTETKSTTGHGVYASDEILGYFVSRTVIVRTRVSGVSLGTLHRVDPAGTVVHLLDAWRVWGWDGAFTLAEVARAGAGELRVDEHPETGVLMTDTAGIEILEITPEILERLKAQWKTGCLT